jgi:epoxyqueuosine reductase
MSGTPSPTGTAPRAELAHWIRATSLELGFDAAGIAAVTPSEHARFYQRWLDAGMHGSMSYLAREDAVRARLDARSAWPGVRSAVVVALHYDSDTASADNAACDVATGVIARYARGRDYHKLMKARLLSLLHRIEEHIGTELPLSRAYVDTGPVFERELARRAGLGWYGRNTMMIHPRRGSYFFIGTLLRDFDLECDAPFTADHCGTCSNCVDACPTGALLGRDADGAPVMNATRCISYLTIENRGPIPRELRPLIGNRIYGCDICQEVCPFTRKFSTQSSEPAFAARAPGEAPFGVQIEAGASKAHPGTRSPSLIALLETALDEAAWDAFSRGSAIRRAGRAGFARNVCVALGNWGSEEAVAVLTRALADDDALVREHAAWALGRVDSAEARSELSAAASMETDTFVLAELSAALAA